MTLSNLQKSSNAVALVESFLGEFKSDEGVISEPTMADSIPISVISDRIPEPMMTDCNSELIKPNCTQESEILNSIPEPVKPDHVSEPVLSDRISESVVPEKSVVIKDEPIDDSKPVKENLVNDSQISLKLEEISNITNANHSDTTDVCAAVFKSDDATKETIQECVVPLIEKPPPPPPLPVKRKVGL